MIRQGFKKKKWVKKNKNDTMEEREQKKIVFVTERLNWLLYSSSVDQKIMRP